MNYIPRLAHAILTSATSIIFVWLWTLDDSSAWLYGAAMFFIITISIMFSLVEGSHYYSVTAYIEALVKMDGDLRNALAFSVPSLRLVAKRGQVMTLFAETHATKKHIHLFLQDSTREQTASKRDWKTSERPAWAWLEIYNYLLSHKMVGAYSVGPESYPWIGTAYQNLAVYFLSQEIHNLNDLAWMEK
jgi:hypothetical protein